MNGMGLVAVVVVVAVVIYVVSRALRSGGTEAVQGGATAAEASIYEQIGGEAAVNLAVDNFYKKVLADDLINRYFEDVDMESQAAKQKAFITMVTGGPNNYTGLDMREAHKHLEGLNDEHFDRVVKHLGDTLTELNVPAHLIAQIAAVAESTRDDVLNRGGEPEAAAEPEAADEASIYEQIGGEAAVNLAVDNFYKKVLADDLINRYFEDVDMESQAAKQKAFITMVTGGPNNYTGLDMREAHKHLEGLNDEHFDRVVKHLGDTLTELNVPAHLIGQIAAVAESTRDDVLNR